MKIDDWRRKIDAIDTALLELVNLRADLAVEVGRLKKEEGLSVRNPEREEQILSRMKSLNPGPLPDDAVTRIFRLILDEAIRTEEFHCEMPQPGRRKKAAPRGNSRKPGRR
ncbi:MAG: chorismate mutase [Candidatus Acidiferrales bacterium]